MKRQNKENMAGKVKQEIPKELLGNPFLGCESFLFPLSIIKFLKEIEVSFHCQLSIVISIVIVNFPQTKKAPSSFR